MLVRKDNVAILDEHTLVQGEEGLEINEQFLQEVVDNNNRRVQETGDKVPIIIGHTEDGVPEEAQPEIVGWASNFSLKKLFNTGRKAIFCTFEVIKD